MTPLRTTRLLSEYAALRLAELVVGLLPRPWALALGALAGEVLYRLHVKRRIAARNLAHVGLWNVRAQRRILRRLYRTTGRYAADLLRPSTVPPPHRIVNYEVVDGLFARGKGVIVLLAHFGNWELLAGVFGRKIRDLNVVAKPMRNRRVERWLLRRRASTGVSVIYARKALRQILAVLRRNGMVAVLIDQHARGQGTVVPFLGKPANTLRGVAGLAHKTGTAVLPTYAILRADGTYDVIIENAVTLPAVPASDEEAVTAYQSLHNEVVSRWVKEHPDHYFGWFHKRFRGSVRY